MARTNRQCGAVSGAIMGLGLATGRNSPEQQVDESYRLVQEFLRRFENEFGSTNCRELTGYDLSTAGGLQAFRESDQADRCRMYTQQASRMAMQLIGD